MANGAVYIRVGGATKEVSNIYVRVGGATKEVSEGWLRTGGFTKKFWPRTPPIDPTTLNAYFAGGYNVGYGVLYSSSDRYNFGTEAISEIASTLSQALYAPFGFSYLDGSSVSRGVFGAGSGSSGMVADYSSFNMATETQALLTSNMTTPRYYGGSANNETDGYATFGSDGAASTGMIEQIDFSTDTVTEVNFMGPTWGVYFNASHGDSAKAYTSATSWAGAPPGGYIMKFEYSTFLAGTPVFLGAAIANDFSSAFTNGAGNGYWAGGNVTDDVIKFAYSTETTSTLTAALAENTNESTEACNYLTAAIIGCTSTFQKVNKFSLTTETSAISGSTLTRQRLGAAGVQAGGMY